MSIYTQGATPTMTLDVATGVEMVVSDNAVCCPGCGVVIGQYVAIGNRTWLQVGPLQLEAAHGRCQFCNTEYHWTASGKMLEDLLARRRQRAIEKP